MGKLTISMAIFNSYVSHNQRANVIHTFPVSPDLGYPAWQSLSQFEVEIPPFFS